MKSVLLIAVVALLLLVISACGGGSEKSVSATSTPPPTTAPQTVSPTPTPSSTLSEQPDMTTYQKYFSDLGIGKIPAGEKDSPLDLQKNVSVFMADDQICVYGTIILECQLRSSICDISDGKVVREGGLPKPMTGGFAGWEPINLPLGKYEYKIYVGDILVGIFPFEVH